MVGHVVKDPKATGCVFLATTGFVAMVVLFTMGGIFFSQEYTKVLNYANSMCRVDSRFYKTYQCKSRYTSRTCYGPAWEVHYGENRTTYAKVEGDKRYNYPSDALKKAHEYQVNKYN